MNFGLSDSSTGCVPFGRHIKLRCFGVIGSERLLRQLLSEFAQSLRTRSWRIDKKLTLVQEFSSFVVMDGSIEINGIHSYWFDLYLVVVVGAVGKDSN